MRIPGYKIPGIYGRNRQIIPNHQHHKHCHCHKKQQSANLADSLTPKQSGGLLQHHDQGEACSCPCRRIFSLFRQKHFLSLWSIVHGFQCKHRRFPFFHKRRFLIFRAAHPAAVVCLDHYFVFQNGDGKPHRFGILLRQHTDMDIPGRILRRCIILRIQRVA